MFFIFRLKQVLAALAVAAAAVLCLSLYFHGSTAVSSIIPDSDRSEGEEKKDFVKWVDFNVPLSALEKAYSYDVNSYTEPVKLDWIELLAYTAAKTGGRFKGKSITEMEKLVKRLRSGEKMEYIAKGLKYYSYYHEAYTAVLGGFLGQYKAENADGTYTIKYGLKAFSPIAKGYSYSHSDDFGNARSYGFKRKHLGNDLMGSIGTPIIAVEGGTVEALGWNMYGGWRIGIRSFDEKRYYYYAHLRKDHPYNKSLKVGSIVKAGDVIGYLGMTGYSTKENVNNIRVPHLHFGIQLIFDESQKEGDNEIWIDVYNIVKFLAKNRSVAEYDPKTKEFYSINNIITYEGE